MNVEGAEVERLLDRSIMPRFHASFSLGTVAGAAIGSLVTLLGVGRLALGTVGVLVAGLGILRCSGSCRSPRPTRTSRAETLRAWTEPRTLVIGLMVLAMALTEGVANDWLGSDGGRLRRARLARRRGLRAFVAAMTAGRVAGTVLLDTFGRLPVLWGSMAVAAVGVLLVVLGQLPFLVTVGIVLWGVGASLGFPVGMSAAADEPAKAAARVSVVSTMAAPRSRRPAAAGLPRRPLRRARRAAGGLGDPDPVGVRRPCRTPPGAGAVGRVGSTR